MEDRARIAWNSVGAENKGAVQVMTEFAEKESLDRAIEELENVLNEYCKPESPACLILLGERIAELNAAQKGEGR